MKKIIIVAADLAHGIGKNGEMPWRIKEEMNHFRETTTGHAVIMGRTTFHSIGNPLPNRHNIVLSRRIGVHPGVAWHSTLMQGIQDAHKRGHQKAFIIGGAQLYQEALPFVDEVILSRIYGDFGCDKFFRFEKHAEFNLVSVVERDAFTIFKWSKK